MTLFRWLWEAEYSTPKLISEYHHEDGSFGRVTSSVCRYRFRPWRCLPRIGRGVRQWLTLPADTTGVR